MNFGNEGITDFTTEFFILKKTIIGLNIDYHIDPKWAETNLKDTVIQGGLNPNVLLLPEQDMIKNAKKIPQEKMHSWVDVY